MDNMDATLRTAVEQAADGFVLTDPSGVIRYANPAFERMSGYARGELLGRHVRLLKSGRHPAEFYRTLWATLCDGRAWSGTFVNRRKDGGLYEDQSVISPVRNAAGGVVGYLAAKRHVTAERQQDRRLRQAQRLDTIGCVAGGVAHEFNNVLMTIIGHAEMLEQRLRQAGVSSDEIVNIKDACDRAAALTRQLLAFGRRQARDLTLVDANRAVRGLEKMLRRLLGDDIRLTVATSSRPALVRVEDGRIERFIMALAVRARDVMPAGGTFSITVCDAASVPPDGQSASAAQGLRGGIALRVADTGGAEDWEAHAPVAQTDGPVSVQCAAGEGTTFTIYLPAAGPDDTSAAACAREPRRRSGVETVLLVEDEDSVRALVRAGLTRLGYRVIDAPDGASALERAAAETGRIGLLITDVVMPGMSARELTARLLALHPTAKVVYMSGGSDAAIGGQEAPDGAAAFLRKPFTMDVLAQRVREVLG